MGTVIIDKITIENTSNNPEIISDAKAKPLSRRRRPNAGMPSTIPPAIKTYPNMRNGSNKVTKEEYIKTTDSSVDANEAIPGSGELELLL